MSEAHWDLISKLENLCDKKPLNPKTISLLKLLLDEFTEKNLLDRHVICSLCDITDKKSIVNDRWNCLHEFVEKYKNMILEIENESD